MPSRLQVGTALVDSDTSPSRGGVTAGCQVSDERLKRASMNNVYCSMIDAEGVQFALFVEAAVFHLPSYPVFVVCSCTSLAMRLPSCSTL